jgi:DNA-binding phage protein
LVWLLTEFTLVDRLQDPAHAAGFIAAVLEEKDPEPELLSSALEDVMAAKIKSGTLSESARQNYEKLSHRLAESGGAEIYALVDLLEAWGMQLAIAPKSWMLRCWANKQWIDFWTMNRLLEEAFRKAQDLPDDLQSELAEQLIEDVENELGWQQTLSQPQGIALDDMAAKALEDSVQGKTRKMGFDELWSQNW